MISRISEEKDISKATLRRYLHQYLVYQRISALAPKQKMTEKALSKDEKNMRWAINKYYYSRRKNSLTMAYTQMLKERYCDAAGNLIPGYPSITFLQQYENHKAVRLQEYSGIIGGSDSFTIIGTSGIGKSTAISKSLDLITASGIIEVKDPFVKVIPCIVVQCPFDSSVKGLLLEILRKVDECLGSKYYERAVRTRSTTDMIIGSVSQVALNHIGLLIVDEIQNVANSRNGKSLIGALTQLINNSGISICMVGTPESAVFFEQAMQLARRSLGLQYARLEYDRYFCDFCCTLFSYQYVKRYAEITPAIIEWLYEHSSGIVSVVVSLIHDAQEIAILDGREELSIHRRKIRHILRAGRCRTKDLQGFHFPDL